MNTSVIIPNWNGLHLLSDCLTSLHNQSFSDFEVIVVDNGSTDGSPGFIKTYFPSVKLIRLDKNYGFAKANNIGFAESVGDRIAVLNNDTVVDENWLATFNQTLDTHPDVGFCASKILLLDQPTIIDSTGDVLTLFGAYNRGHNEVDQPKYNLQQYVFGACAAAAIYRRSMLEDIGFFDDIYVTSFEDVDLSFRAQLAGYKCLYVPNAIVYHKRRETIRKVQSHVQLLSYRNKRILWLKNAPTSMVIKFFPYFLLGEFYLNLLKPFLRYPLKKNVRPQSRFKLNVTILVKMLIIGNLSLIYQLPEIFKKELRFSENAS
jgi:GT2 family glycosyltransferase